MSKEHYKTLKQKEYFKGFRTALSHKVYLNLYSIDNIQPFSFLFLS